MPWQSTLSWENAQKRANILQRIRQFFADRNVVEVETPALSQGTVTDVHLDFLVIVLTKTLLISFYKHRPNFI